MRKIQITGALALLLCASTSHGQNLTEQSVNRAQAVIEQAVAAYGGEALTDLKTVVIESETINIASGQSHKPGPPWDRREASGLNAMRFADNTFVVSNKGSGGGFEFNNATVISDGKGHQVDYRAGTQTAIAEPDFATTSGPFIRITPALLVRELRNRAHTAHYLGSTKIDKRDYDVISMVMEVGPALSLYFDKKTHLLDKSERYLPQFGLIEYFFHDYKKVAGIPFNGRFELYVAGEPNMDRKLVSTKVNVPVDQHATVAAELAATAVAPPEPQEVSRRELASGVYHIGGNNTYALFVEMEDHVVAIGGTGGIDERIRVLREVVPTKPIKYGVLTHHHSDHILGAQVYAEQGATIITAKAHADTVRTAVGDEQKVDIETVGRRTKVLKDRSRRIEILDIGPTAHANNFLLAYLPEEGIIFEADHFSMPLNGVLPTANTAAKSFAAALKKHKINVKTIASAHSSRTSTMAEMNASLAKQPVKVSAN